MIMLERLLIHLAAYLALAEGFTPSRDAASFDTRAWSARAISLMQTRSATVRKVMPEEHSHDTALPLPVPAQTMSLLDTRQTTVVRKVVKEVDETGQAIVPAAHNVTQPASHNVTQSTLQRVMGKATNTVHSLTSLLHKEFTMLRQHPWKLWEQASLLGRGLVPKDPAGVPVRSGKQMMIVFVAVFGTVGISWSMFLFRSRFGGAGSLHRFRLVTLCLSLSACSWGMTVANKHLMMKIGAPGFVIAVQMTIAVVVAIILAGGRLSLESKQVKWWIIVPLFACVQLWTSLYTMKHLTLSMLMIIRNLGPVVTLPCEMFVMPVSKRPVVTRGSVFALLLVLASAATYFGGISPSWQGCMFAFINMILAVIDVVLRRRLLTTECAEMSTTMCMLLNNLAGIVPSMLLAFCTGELLDVSMKTAFSTYTIGVLLASGVIGAGISFCALNVQREIAATSFMVLENGIRLAEVLAGVLLFKDPFTWPSQVIGLLISYFGSLWYAKVQVDSCELSKDEMSRDFEPMKFPVVNS